MGVRTLLLLVTLATSSGPIEARAQDPAVVYIGGAAVAAVVPEILFDLSQPDADQAFFKASSGHFDAVDDENEAVDLLVEYQPGLTWYRIKPLFGLAGNSDGTIYGWISAAHDVHLGDRVVINVNSGPALYVAGEGAKDLGSAGLLRSGVEIGYRFDDDARLTVSFHHMSHGKVLNAFNPGAETLAIGLTWPLN